MRMQQSTWQRTQARLAQDFLDLFLAPSYPFPVESEYPCSPGMGPALDRHFANMEWPETKLIRLQSYVEENDAETFSRRVADWAVVFGFDLLDGFGHGTAAKVTGDAFEGLRQLADTWGEFIAREVQRTFGQVEVFSGLLDIMPDLIVIINQVPAKELGDAIRAAMTPAYVRASELAAYQFALLNNDQSRVKDCQAIINASDPDLQREIDGCFEGYSSQELGQWLQRQTIEVASVLRELFSSNQFKEYCAVNRDIWTALGRQMSWSIGYRLRRNMEHDPARTTKLLEAVDRFREISAVMEQYRYNYGWRGDPSKAIAVGWGVVAPKYFQLSGNIARIKRDEDEERLIGLAEGLRNYTAKNPATVAIPDGFLGKIGGYLHRSAANQENDYSDKQDTEGNKALSEARHAVDFYDSTQMEEGDASDDQVLSREREKFSPSRNPTVEQPECEETRQEWFNVLTEREREVIMLKLRGETRKEVGLQLGISQARISQLMASARKKFPIMTA